MGHLALGRGSRYLDFGVSRGRDLDLGGDSRSRALGGCVRTLPRCRCLIPCGSVDLRCSGVGIFLDPVLVVVAVGVGSLLVDEAG